MFLNLLFPILNAAYRVYYLENTLVAYFFIR